MPQAKKPSSPPITPTGIAKEAASRVFQSELVRQTAQDHVLSQIEKRQAKGQATRFAEQTNSEVAHVQFPDGPERWTVFKDGTPVVAFPVYTGDLETALSFHDFSRLRMRKPGDLAKEIEAERQNRRLRLPARGRTGSTGKQANTDPTLDFDEEESQ